MRRNRVDVITLGCSKNLVDSEVLMRQFMANGYTVHHDPATVSGEIVVVNTCGFIGDAQEESVNAILEMVEAKKSGRIGQLYVMGCLSERFLDDLKKEIPEVDAYYGKFNWKQLLSHLGKSYYAEAENRRKLTTPRHYAYLKISEGCDRSCSYCAIPIITGRHHSRPIEDLEEEVRALVRRGTHEFQLIAQDLTFYGIDLYGGNRLAELTKRLSDIKGVEWLRLHYAYPAHFPLDLLRVMRERPNVCKYLDMALQHISDPMLKLMRRQITKAETYDLIETIRREVPGIHLRTTLMTGHPGETDADFAELLQFVRDIRFERLGAFTYSHESGTYCDKHYQDKIPESVKQERLGELMAVQERIAATYNEAKVGSRMRVVIDRAEDGFYIGRTEYDSPEVDPEVLIPFVDGQVLKPGQFHMAEITEAEPFDLYARIID
ncbi:30S ribosomal protein S12 methylthiotransferase RimO [Porphyromonas loveana]|uniref:30S ribosomal protein S12 methylthiotransferase RimO n=1 Tax=Porphyromonas loveana TaxID=1884669 RepID=UPI00359FB599